MSRATLDKVCAAAVEDARAALLAVAPADEVGDWIEAVPDAERVVTHYFTAHSPSYVGWRWAVTVARASRAKSITVDEIVLLPGDGALLAPPWLPWEDRIAPGDLGVGDLLPPPPDDPRLEPGYTGSDATAAADGPDGDAPLRPEQWQLGLGRSQVLSAWGRDDAATRWHEGEFGAAAPMAAAAPAHCGSCGFLIPVGGALGQRFGLCGNEMAPADGRVVDLAYGCGAHSATPVVAGTSVLVSAGVVDAAGYDIEPGRGSDD
ncbi:MAG TPA: DUF3027 domain-containing protein [Candidatus Nanopelagicales bacterium]|nr:DUF3027 domain-containing protein [Candidatus Nanopelagicales bacterium]